MLRRLKDNNTIVVYSKEIGNFLIYFCNSTVIYYSTFLIVLKPTVNYYFISKPR